MGNKNSKLQISLLIHIDEVNDEIWVEQVAPYNNAFKMVADNQRNKERDSIISGLVEALNLVIRSSDNDYKLLEQAKTLLLNKWSKAEPENTFQKQAK